MISLVLIWTSRQHVLTQMDSTQQPGFDLSHRSRPLLQLLNRSEGRCLSNLHKWGLATTNLCACAQREIMNHIVDLSHLTRFENSLQSLHDASDDAVYWHKNMATTAFAK